MTTIYGGKPANITLPTALTVTGVTNTVPATVTVSGSLPADFYLGAAGFGGTAAAVQVDVTGVQGATGANGIWTATPTGASTFTINNSVAPGAYTSGGSVQPIALDPLITVPSDGEPATIESLASMCTDMADRTQWNATRTGVAKLASRIVWTFGDLSDATGWATNNESAAVANTWYPAGGSGFNMTVEGGIGQNGSCTAGSVEPPLIVTGVTPLDAFRFRVQTTFISSPTATVRVGLWYALVAPGAAAPTPLTGYTQVPGASQLCTSPAAVALEGWIPIQGVGNLYVIPAFYSLASTGLQEWSLVGDSVVTVEVWRQTGMPQ